MQLIIIHYLLMNIYAQHCTFPRNLRSNIILNVMLLKNKYIPTKSISKKHSLFKLLRLKMWLLLRTCF